MADQDTQPQPEPTPAPPEPGSAEWLDQKTAEPEPAAEKPPEAPAVAEAAQPTDQGDNWWETGLADAKHGFLKGRKGPEVEHAFRATETEMKKAQQRAKDAETLVQQANARAAALELAIQQQKQQQAPAPDPAKEIEQIFFEQGPAAAFKRQSELNAAAIQAEAERIANLKLQQFQQTTSDQARLSQQALRVKAAFDAAEAARQDLKVDQSAWDNERGLVVSARIMNQFGNDGLTDVKNWTDTYKAIYPEAQTAPAVTAPVVTPPPPVTNPPGSHRPAPVQQKPNAGLPTLDGEERRALEFLAEAGGVDPEKLIAKHQAKARRANG